MTRETKVGLLVGMGVILLVGIIVTDHLSLRSPDEGLSPLMQSHGAGVRTMDVPPGFDNGAQWTDVPGEWGPVGNPEPVDSNPVPASMEPAMIGQPPAGPEGEVAAIFGPPSGEPLDTSVLTVGDNPRPELFGSQQPQPVQTVHYVKKNDTPWKLAQQYYGDGTKYPLIVDANPGKIRNGTMMREGVQLVIPSVPESAAPSGNNVTLVRDTPRAVGSKYTIREGDTLWSIAQRQLGDGSRYKEIQQANHKVVPSTRSVLPVGAELTLPKR